MHDIQIGRHVVGQSHRPYVLAELGLNHNGCVDTCLRMVDAAQASGADGVKLQSYFTSEFLLSGSGGYSIFERCELSVSETERVMRHCREVGVDFLATPLTLSWVRILEDLKVDAFKVASPDLVWLDLLQRLAAMERPLILSTGMATEAEISNVLERPFLQDSEIILLHCVSNYPPRLEDNHLRFLLRLAELHKGPVGFSDHSLGSSLSIASIALGTRFIEKHLTLDKDMAGPDHRMSVDPSELKDVCRGVQEVFKALGERQKPLIEAEAPVREVARRGLWLRQECEGEIELNEGNAMWLRPANGVDSFTVSLLRGEARVEMQSSSINVGKHGKLLP